VSERLFDWLLDGVPGAREPVDVAERIGVELVAAGIPVDRLVVWVTTLHPTVAGREFTWRPNERASVRDLTLAGGRSPSFKASPVAIVFSTGREVRRRIDDAAAAEFPILADLKAQGYTDYLCAPLLFTNGEIHGAAIATRHPVGFSDADLAAMRHMLRPLARIAEILALRRIATTLLSTYVGHNSGARILAGRITRGDVETLQAVIWFSDLRGFTEMSSRSSPREIIEVLNELFDCQVPAIDRHGGEVLKFMGDGLLAIFPLAGDADVAKRCADALAAARDSFAALDERNAKAASAIHFGLALHVGEVAYGNIGSASRLDFTAIGPAVNLSARLEGLTGRLDRRVVLSAELAAHAAVPLVDLGTFELKGVPGTPRVFGLDGDIQRA
jgi:adenylate cyclase